MSGPTHATLERIRTQEVVLRVPDTTFLPGGTTQPKAGLGIVTLTRRDESLRHATVALTPARVHLGGGRQVWPRSDLPVAQQRPSQPIEEKERARWREGSQDACKVKQAWPATLVVRMADREGDRQEWGGDARRREPDHRVEYLMRATGDRRLAPGAAQRDVWAERQPTPALGTRTLALARQPERPPRPGPLAGTAQLVPLQGARRPGGKRPPVTVSAVYAQEPSPAQDEEPLAW